MIEQDNRQKNDALYERIELLKSLLREDSVQEEAPAADMEEKLQDIQIEKEGLPPDDKDKSVFIMVTGDNNIISTGKSKLCVLSKKKKNALLAFSMCFLLFFLPHFSSLSWS